MARVLQLRRGTTAENDLFTGAVGELTMDTTTNQLRIHDGSTAGGYIIAADKLDLDTGNATSSTKETIVGWGMPDYSAGVEKTRGVDFTVSQNSVLWVTTDDFGTDSYIYINDVQYLIGGGAGFYSASVQSSFVPVPTGTKIKVVFGRTYSGDRNKIICFPCIGG